MLVLDTDVDIALREQINENSAAGIAAAIAQEIQNAGYEAYFVGGGVRDLILRRWPEDFDIATSATPDILQKLYPDAVLVGAKFGVLLVKRSGTCVEVATFREEGEYHDRRRPDLVRFSSLEKDAVRRDFTVNALYYDPESDKVIDLVGGLDDVKARVLRTVNTALDRFREDALRVIRALRFAANLDFKIENHTWTAICECMVYLREISVERIRDEMLKGLTGGHPARFLDLLEQSGFTRQFLPEIEALKGCEQPPAFHPEGDVYVHTRLMLEKLKKDPTAELAMAVLLHDIGKPPTQTYDDRIRFNGHDKLGADMAERICRRFRMPNQQTETIGDMVRRHMQFINVPSMRKSTLNRFLASTHIDDELELHRVDCLASHGNLETYEYSQQKLREFREADDFKGHLPPALVNGDDLIRLGFTPGPAFGPILRNVYDAQLDGKFKTKAEGLELAGKLAKN